MKEIFLGEVIRQRRLELGLTQEELCEGICEPMTISKTGQTRDSVVEAVERRLVVFLPGIQPPVVARCGHEGEQTQVVW